MCRLKSHFQCFRTPRPPTVRSRGSVPLRHAPPTPTHPLAPPCPPPPLCTVRACGVWWRADVCVPLCVSCEQYGQTPLVFACGNGHRDVALRLLRLGADPAIQDIYVSPPPAPLRHQRCVCGVRGVLGHVCGGRVSGRVLRGTEDLGTEFERPTCPKSLFQICCHFFYPDERIVPPFILSVCIFVDEIFNFSCAKPWCLRCSVL